MVCSSPCCAGVQNHLSLPMGASASKLLVPVDYIGPCHRLAPSCLEQPEQCPLLSSWRGNYVLRCPSSGVCLPHSFRDSLTMDSATRWTNVCCWIDTRRRLSHATGRNQLRRYSVHIYTDDPVFSVVGQEPLLRALRIWHDVTSSFGLRMAIARPSTVGGGGFLLPGAWLLVRPHLVARRPANSAPFGSFPCGLTLCGLNALWLNALRLNSQRLSALCFNALRLILYGIYLVARRSVALRSAIGAQRLNAQIAMPCGSTPCCSVPFE